MTALLLHYHLDSAYTVPILSPSFSVPPIVSHEPNTFISLCQYLSLQFVLYKLKLCYAITADIACSHVSKVLMQHGGKKPHIETLWILQAMTEAPEHWENHS